MSQRKRELMGIEESNEATRKWDRRFLRVANEFASWSKDPSTKVGACIVRRNGTLASAGYNGFARGVADHQERYDKRETKYEMIVHAEVNALHNTQENLEGATLYVTPLPPCPRCAGQIIQRGIKRVVVERRKVSAQWDKDFELSKTMFEEAGVTVDVVMPEDFVPPVDSSIVVPKQPEA